jgi:hypothetical protein
MPSLTDNLIVEFFTAKWSDMSWFYSDDGEPFRRGRTSGDPFNLVTLMQNMTNITVEELLGIGHNGGKQITRCASIFGHVAACPTP